MQLHEKQKEIVKSLARFKVIRAGRRSGKSSVAVDIMLFTAVSGKGKNIFYISPTQKQSRSIIWELVKKRLRWYRDWETGLGLGDEKDFV